MIGKYHRSITTEALNSQLNQSEVNLVCDSNVDSDSLFSKKQGESDGYNVTAQHFNKTDLSNCEEFLQDAKDVTVDDFTKAANSTTDEEKEKNYTKAFYDFGRVTHCVQDFYSHTNWINQTGNEERVWNESVDKPNIDNPKNLKTGQYSAFSQFLDKINIFKHLRLTGGKDYKKTYEENTDQSHYILNKDQPNSIADKAFKKQEGASGFDLACEDATKHTEKEWGEITEALKKQLDDTTYEKFMNDIKDFNPTDQKITDSNKECKENFNEKMKEENNK